MPLSLPPIPIEDVFLALACLVFMTVFLDVLRQSRSSAPSREIRGGSPTCYYYRDLIGIVQRRPAGDVASGENACHRHYTISYALVMTGTDDAFCF